MDKEKDNQDHLKDTVVGGDDWEETAADIPDFLKQTLPAEDGEIGDESSRTLLGEARLFQPYPTKEIHADKLQEVDAKDRKIKALENQAKTLKKQLLRDVAQKKLCKTGLMGVKNFDALAGFIERILFVIIPAMLMKGEYLDAVLIGVLVIVLWYYKVKAGQGPIISFIAKVNRQQITTKLINLSKTVIRTGEKDGL